ncbi:MAG TPA: FAD-dependent oxidoreductase [Chloroflexota bacterium]|nr:FAD-dependent oxidoreductase [Chloroflexota bacterium]
MPRSYVIIGNGIAGTSAAETIRKTDATARIVLIAEEPYPLYNRVALPPYLKLRVTEKKVLMRTAEQHQQRGIELLLNTRAEQLDAENRIVYADNGEQYPYDALLLATGGTPNHIDVPGAESHGVCYFQTLDDTNEILEIAQTAKHAVTFGGSYISYELTEAFASRNILTSWVMRGPRFLRQILDDVGGQMVEKLAAMHDVSIIYGDEPGQIDVKHGSASAAWTKTKKRLAADLVGCGFGLRINTRICRGTDIHIHRGILTDRFLETNVPGIYSAGDCAEFYDMYLHIYNMLGTWESAGLQGRLAAANMMCEHPGDRRPFSHVPTYTSTLFDSKITVFGSTPADQPMLESVMDHDMDAFYYKRLFFHEHLLVGGVLIGPAAKSRTPLMQLVKERREIPNEERQALLTLAPSFGAAAKADEAELEEAEVS